MATNSPYKVVTTTKLFEWFKLNLRKILILVKSRVFIGFILKNQSMLEVPLNQN